VSERVCVCVRERERVCVCVREREMLGNPHAKGEDRTNVNPKSPSSAELHRAEVSGTDKAEGRDRGIDPSDVAGLNCRRVLLEAPQNEPAFGVCMFMYIYI
jgi:hypothetical protein